MVSDNFTRRRLFITTFIVEIVFVIIFLLIMFASIDAAAFLIGLLTFSLILEIIAFPINIGRIKRTSRQTVGF